MENFSCMSCCIFRINRSFSFSYFLLYTFMVFNPTFLFMNPSAPKRITFVKASKSSFSTRKPHLQNFWKKEINFEAEMSRNQGLLRFPCYFGNPSQRASWAKQHRNSHFEVVFSPKQPKWRNNKISQPTQRVFAIFAGFFFPKEDIAYMKKWLQPSFVQNSVAINIWRKKDLRPSWILKTQKRILRAQATKFFGRNWLLLCTQVFARVLNNKSWDTFMHMHYHGPHAPQGKHPKRFIGLLSKWQNCDVVSLDLGLCSEKWMTMAEKVKTKRTKDDFSSCGLLFCHDFSFVSCIFCEHST